MNVQPIQFDWSPQFSIFAKESFLSSVSDVYGWLGGFSESGELKCVLPYTLIRKGIFLLARFRVETIVLALDFSISEEKDFLNGVVRYLRSRGADAIIPATTNTLFRTYPEDAVPAPYGSYVIDLLQSEDTLWKNIDRITRQNIKSAMKSGVIIREARPNDVEIAYRLIKETFRRSRLPFMDQSAFMKMLSGLGEYGRLLIADHEGVVQSACVLAYSDYCAYAIYAGNLVNQRDGSNKLLYWDAMRRFKELGTRCYDFVGARIDPERGSKQEALSLFKKRFGAVLKQGFMWKCSLRPFKYQLYEIAARLRSGGDIVDIEKHKMKGIIPPSS